MQYIVAPEALSELQSALFPASINFQAVTVVMKSSSKQKAQ